MDKFGAAIIYLLLLSSNLCLLLLNDGLELCILGLQLRDLVLQRLHLRWIDAVVLGTMFRSN